MPGVNDPLVSIVIPCYAAAPRHAALLGDTLETVAAQTYRSIQTIVVDDGSLVDIGQVAARYDATLIRQPNSGIAAARNAGIAASRGSLLLFLDSDDYLLPVGVAAGVAGLLAHADAGFSVGAREEMTFEGQPVPWAVPAPPKISKLYYTLLGFDWNIIPPSSAMFRREAVEQVGGFRDPWGPDDVDFYLRVARCYEAWCHDTPVTRYRRYSTSTSRDGERMLRTIRIVYERQWPLVQGDPAGEAAFARGLGRYTTLFTDCLVENVADRVKAREWRRALHSVRMLARESPARLVAAIGRAV